MRKPLLAVLFLACWGVASGQVSKAVSDFIAEFSFAATRVDLKPDEHGQYPHLADLGNAVVILSKADDETVTESFKLLDKNQSLQRLAVADLLLILMYNVPSKTDWTKPQNLSLRDALIPLPSENSNSSTWPWQDKGNGLWQLQPFGVEAEVRDKRMGERLEEFSSKFKRRS